MNAMGIYLYCFARPGAARSLKATGVNGGAITSLEHDDVAAVLGEVALEDFSGGSGRARTQDPAWLIPRVCQHDAVIREVMERSSVLPVRFGAVFASEQKMEGLLAQQGGEISAFLDYVADKEEWAVKGFVDLEKAGTWLLETTPSLSEQRRRMASSPGARYFQEKQLRAEVHRCLRLWRNGVAEQVHGELKRLAEGACGLRLQEKEADGEMMFHCAFLVPKERLADLGGCVEQLRVRYDKQGLNLHAIGPWPPYSFCPGIGGMAHGDLAPPRSMKVGA